MDEEINLLQITKGDVILPDQAMQLAMQVAKGGAPFVSPNPVVGCVIVSEDHLFLASGYHHRFGEAHAEIDALQKLTSDELKGSIFYVTLEPCSHQGKTGSCAKKIAELGVHKVVYGIVDPNPLVSGQGAVILKAALVLAVEYEGPLKAQLYELSEVFLTNFIEKRIFVAAKVASSLDGQIALKKTGESKWITSESSRNYVHELRSYYDGVVIGRKTIETDNPSLNIRHDKIKKFAKIIILDPDGKILEQIDNGKKFKFLEVHAKENIFFAIFKQVESSLQQIEFTDLENLLKKLWDLNFRSVFVEGGATTYSNFLKEGLVDRLYIFLAPVLIGSGNGLSWTEGLRIDSLEKKIHLRQIEIKHFGSDLLITGRITPGSKSKNC